MANELIGLLVAILVIPIFNQKMIAEFHVRAHMRRPVGGRSLSRGTN